MLYAKNGSLYRPLLTSRCDRTNGELKNFGAINYHPAPEVTRAERKTIMKETFNTYSTEEEARLDMKRLRKRKFTINYSAYRKCWIAWYNI